MIGRAIECEICIDLSSLSRQHARIEWTPAGWIVEDRESTGGTFVNEIRVQRAILHPRDVVRLGRVILRFEDDGTDRPPPSDTSSGGTPLLNN